MVLYDILAILIVILAILITFYFLKKIWGLFSKDKEKANRVLESLSVALLAVILFNIIQIYWKLVQDLPSIDIESVKPFLSSLFIIVGKLVIITVITFAVIMFATYFLLKSTFKEQKK